MFKAVLNGVSFSLGLTFLFLLKGICFAGAIPHGAKAAGMGTAFIAVADDPSAMMYNPAGLTQVKGALTYSGGTILYTPTKFENLAGLSQKTDTQIFFPPHFYAASDFKTENFRFGLGLFSPFGIGGKKWSQSGLTRYGSTTNAIATVAAQPTFAWRVAPCLSIGFGFSYMHAFNTSEKMMDQSFLGAGDARLKLKGDGGGWGYNFGLLLFPREKLSIGFAYRSIMKVEQDFRFKIENIASAVQPLFPGGSRFETRAESSLDFPQIVSAGVAYRPTDFLTLAFDMEWLEWSRFYGMCLSLKQQVPQAGISDIFIPFHFKNTWLFKTGMEYKVNEKLSLRAGYTYAKNPVPAHTLSPGNPDSNQHDVSAGFGYDFGKIFLDASYSALIYEQRSVINDILSGKYNTLGHAVGLSMGYRFR